MNRLLLLSLLLFTAYANADNYVIKETSDKVQVVGTPYEVFLNCVDAKTCQKNLIVAEEHCLTYGKHAQFAGTRVHQYDAQKEYFHCVVINDKASDERKNN